MKASTTIDLPCQCGKVRHWAPPHNSEELFCEGCGSHFNLLEIEGESDYVITSSGPVRIIGSEAPAFKDLPVEEREKLQKEVDELNQKKNKP